MHSNTYPVDHGSTCKNIVTKLDGKLFMEVVDDIIGVLQHHCGPYASFAMIVPNINATSLTNKFTKDGITILKNIQYESIMKQVILEMIFSVGEAIDKKIGDGTTSGTLLFCYFFKYLSEHRKDMTSFNESRFAFKEFTESIQDIVDEIKVQVTEENMEKLVRAQCMTSSHGDRNITEKVLEFFKAIPPEAYDTIVYERSKLLDDDAFKIKNIPANEYTLRGSPVTEKGMNSKGNTECVLEDTTLLVCPFIVSSPINVDEDPIIVAIKTYQKEDIPVAIIAQGFDSSILKKINELGVYAFTITKDNNTSGYSDLEVLIARCGYAPEIKSPSSVMFNTLPNCKVRANLQLEITVTVDPNVVDPDTILNTFEEENFELKEYLDILRSQIDVLSHATDSGNLKMYDEFKSFYNRIINLKQTCIVIGGGEFDNIANKDVLEDCLKSVRSVLKYGCVPGGFGGLYTATLVLMNKTQDSNIMGFCKALKRAIEDVRNHINGDESIIERLNDMRLAKDIDLYFEYEHSVIEPANLNKTMLNIIGELAYRMAHTSSIIIPEHMFEGFEDKVISGNGVIHGKIGHTKDKVISGNGVIHGKIGHTTNPCIGCSGCCSVDKTDQ